MTRGRLPLVGGALAVATLVQHAGAAQSPTPTQTPQAVFRTNTDLVTVPVFVKGSGDVVSRLAAGDFVLTDNGVRQTVETIDSESLPVDVTLLMETGEAIEHYRDSLNEQVRKIAALMRPTDRIEVLGIDNYVSVLVPFGPPTRPMTVEKFSGGGMLSVNDALVAALLRESDPDRRHLIIAMTDSIDTMSTLSMANVRDVAKQSRSTLVVSWITLSADGDPSPNTPWATSAERLGRHIRIASERTVPRRQQWAPHYDPPAGRPWNAFAALREATELTGGSVHPPGVFTDRNASAIFDKIYAEFRRNYTLRYLPQGVARDGWHDLKVSIPSAPGAEVRARRGYLVEPKPPEIPPPPPPPPTPGSIGALTVAMVSGDVAATRAAISATETPERLLTLLTDFEAAGTAGQLPQRREFATALLLADAALQSSSDDTQNAALAMLQRYAALVRPPLGPDAFEREWLRAEAAVLIAATRPADAYVPLANAVIRFPGDPQLLLARAIIGDQFVTGLPGAAGGRVVAPAAIDQALGFFDAALKQPTVAQEARIRKGWLLKRQGRASEAQVSFDVAANAGDADPLRQSWLRLVVGEPVQPLPSMEGESWRTYWRVTRRAIDATLSDLFNATR